MEGEGWKMVDGRCSVEVRVADEWWLVEDGWGGVKGGTAGGILGSTDARALFHSALALG